MGSKEKHLRRVAEVAESRMIEGNGIVQVSQIPGAMEQQFFLYLAGAHTEQGAKIIYEPHVFRIYDKNGNTESTTPDFLIITPEGTRFYIEITTSELNGRDPKRKQKHIMSHFPEVDYRVLYKADLKKIQEENPKFSFFHAKRLQA
ncbi:MAG: hypothetical protein HYW62_00060 [Candidatus Levybacteria bacterium]|nr:hypothetical protein [Candidatus Levybacteria bacterium]